MLASNRRPVLIVDDTPTNVAVVSGVLKDSFRTKVATNGEKALAVAAGAEKPDLILLDVMMPGMDGYEVCRRLKDIPATRDIPIIFLTGKTDEADEEKGFDVGGVDYIHKPFSAPIVLARVRNQLALQEALAEAKEARNQADQLLHALLPKKVADEIRSIGTVIPRRYENVAVLFCDVTNFTAYKHEPEDVVSRLDSLFVIFERITAKHGLDKVKTIGDGFMAVAGLLHKVNDRIGSAVRCGLEMTSTLVDAQLNWESGWASMLAQSWPVLWAKSATSSTSGATPSTSPPACPTSRRREASPSPKRSGESSLRISRPSRWGRWTSRAKARSPSSACVRGSHSWRPVTGRLRRPRSAAPAPVAATPSRSL